MKKIFWSIIPLLLLIGCIDEGGPTANKEDHFIAYGMKFSVPQGNEVYRVYKGFSQDTLNLQPDTTYHFAVDFLGKDSSVVSGPGEHSHHVEGSVDKINDEVVRNHQATASDPVQIMPHNPEFLEENNLPYWTFSLKTGPTGTAVVRFFAIHVDHSDFTSPQIYVRVSSSATE